jgi:outer membrane cobalamin receptor
VELPSYTTVDLSSRYTILRAGQDGRVGLDLTARVENLFDEDYEQVVAFLSPGRAIFAGLATYVR